MSDHASGATPPARPRVAVFDYFVTENSPSGKCVLRLVEALSDRYDFTIFAVEVSPQLLLRVRWIRIPAIRFPLVGLFLSYHLGAAIRNFVEVHVRRHRFDLTLTVESNAFGGQVVYSHFCHSFYRRHLLGKLNVCGLAGIHKALGHALHAYCEPLVFARARTIIVPSEALKTQIIATFPGATNKLYVVPNAVEIADTDDEPALRADVRKRLGFKESDLVVIFVALGNFEHKGLSILLESLTRLKEGPVRLLIVGGTGRSLGAYRAKVDEYGLTNHVVFAGFQKDVRQFYRASDLFVLPSLYETLPLCALEAAAHGLPLVISPIESLKDVVLPGATGWIVKRSADALALAFAAAAQLGPEQLRQMGQRARVAVQRFNPDQFVKLWRKTFAELTGSGAR